MVLILSNCVAGLLTAYVKEICALRMRGSVKCFLPRGIYILSWRLSFLKCHAVGFAHPVKFSIGTSNNEEVHLETFFTGFKDDLFKDDRLHILLRRMAKGSNNVVITDDNWLEVTVGEFTVRTDDSPIEIDFSLSQIAGGYVKRGMFVGSVIIRPKSVLVE